MKSLIEGAFDEHQEVWTRTRATLLPVLEEAAALVVETLRVDHKVLICGNGGSAADAQHIAAELTGRFVTERRALPAIALTTDTSALTAMANDLGYEAVFARQVEALGRAGDLLIAISTSGNSPNVNRAARQAKALGCRVIGFTGRAGGTLKELSDLCLVVPSDDTARIQEMHILMGHIICAAVDAQLTDAP